MKLLVFLLSLMLVAGCGSRSEWQELAVPDGGFAILMRGAPHYVPQQFNTPAGKLSAHLYSSDRPDAYFAVGYTDYPLALAVTSAPEKVFEGARDTWVKRIDGRLTSTTPLKLENKHPGMQFTATGKYQERDVLVEGRLFLVDQRLYQIIAMSRQGEVAQGVVNRYFESFRMIPVSYTEHVKIKPPPVR